MYETTFSRHGVRNSNGDIHRPHIFTLLSCACAFFITHLISSCIPLKQLKWYTVCTRYVVAARVMPKIRSSLILLTCCWADDDDMSVVHCTPRTVALVSRKPAYENTHTPWVAGTDVMYMAARQRVSCTNAFRPVFDSKRAFVRLEAAGPTQRTIAVFLNNQ